MLVVAGSGAMGSFAVQLAKASGAEFTAVCSIRNVEMVRSLGADHVVEYTREDFADGRVRYDRIIDVFGRNSVSRLRRAVTTRGRLVIVGGEGTGGSAAFNGSCGATLLSPFVRQQLGTFVVKEHARYLLQLRLLERRSEPVRSTSGLVARSLAQIDDGERDRGIAGGRALGPGVSTWRGDLQLVSADCDSIAEDA